jgi:hypothetical protein
LQRSAARPRPGRRFFGRDFWVAIFAPRENAAVSRRKRLLHAAFAMIS